MRKNTMKEKLQRGEAVVGFTVPGEWPEIVEILGYLGSDYVWLDGQHGALGIEAIANLVRAAEVANVTPLARLPWHNRELVLSYLDVGVQGIIAPDVTSKEQAEAIVRAAKYYPEGMRGWGYGHFAEFYAVGKTYKEVHAEANRETCIILQCESKAGLDNLEEIVSVPGVDIIMLGPMDLSQSLGISGEFDNPIHKEAMAKARRIVLAAGKVVGEIGWDEDFARKRIAEGVRFINKGAVGFLMNGARAYLKGVREGK